MEIEMKFMTKIMQSRFFLSTLSLGSHFFSLCGIYSRMKNEVLDKFNDSDV